MYNDYLSHHGTKGQKWGVRRYQNKDGSLKPLGERHRERREHEQPSSSLERKLNDIDSKINSKVISRKEARMRGKALAEKYSTEKVIKFGNRTLNIGMKLVEKNYDVLNEMFSDGNVNRMVNNINKYADTAPEKWIAKTKSEAAEMYNKRK